MLVVAITGGLGSGKSEVTKIFGELGAYTLNADDLAREVRETPDTIAQIVEILGDDVVDEHGVLSKERMAEVIFSDEAKKQEIEALMHPKIFDAMVERCHHIETQDSDALVAIEIPLLAEVGWKFEHVIVVTVDEEVAIERAVGRGMTEVDARTRRSQQATDGQRMMCGQVVFVVDNSGDRDTLRAEVTRLRDRLSALDIAYMADGGGDVGRSLARDFFRVSERFK